MSAALVVLDWKDTRAGLTDRQRVLPRFRQSPRKFAPVVSEGLEEDGNMFAPLFMAWARRNSLVATLRRHFSHLSSMLTESQRLEAGTDSLEADGDRAA